VYEAARGRAKSPLKQNKKRKNPGTLSAYRQDIEEFTKPSGDVAEALNVPLQVILTRELLRFWEMIHTLPCVQLCPRNLPTYRGMSSQNMLHQSRACNALSKKRHEAQGCSVVAKG
jgi:hypothetical protein